MSAHVVVVQHGEKEPRPGNPELTQLGRRQALAAADVLTSPRPVVVASSPLLRAQQTAGPLCNALGVEPRIDSRLLERINLEPDTEPARFLEYWARSTRDRTWIPPNGRSSLATASDMLAAIDEYARDERTIVLFGHGGATSDLLRTLLGDEELQRRSPRILLDGPTGGSLTRLQRDNAGTWQVTAIAEPPQPAPRRSR
jgi:broad specificity phosphatase PhoE